MTEVTPYPKERQLARGERRYRRTVASPKQWQQIVAAKSGPCRICGSRQYPGLHHVVPRDFHGDDLAQNIVPLCFDCHQRVTDRQKDTCALLVWKLSDAEYAYAIGKLGEKVWERIYGIEYSRG